MHLLLTFVAASGIAVSLANPAILKRQDEPPPPPSALGEAIDAITSAVVGLDATIVNIQGAEDAPDVIAAADKVASAIQTGTEDVAAADMLTQDQAFSLVVPINTLASQVNQTVFDVVFMKDIIVDNCFGNKAYQILVQQNELALEFNRTAIAKIPEPFPGPAVDLVFPLFFALTSGISAYADQSTVIPECSSSSTTTSTTVEATPTTVTTTGSSSNPTYPTGGASPTPSAYATQRPPHCHRKHH